MGQNLPIIPPAANIPPPNSSTVLLPSGQDRSSRVQPTITLISWGYTYPKNQPPMIHQAYQTTLSATVYPGMPYPGNVLVPWQKPNWYNVPSYGGDFVNIA